MNTFGLPDTTLKLILDCIKNFPSIKWVKIYGSRALGNYKKGSDIDLAFSGPEDYSASLLASLDLLSTPYSFDVTYYDDLANPNLKSHIDRVGRVIFDLSC